MSLASTLGLEQETVRPKQKAIDQLKRVQPDKVEFRLRGINVHVVDTSKRHLKLFGCPSEIGVPLTRGITGSFVVADPFVGSLPVETWKGAIVVVQRGGEMSFSDKLRAVEQAGGSAMVLVQTTDVFPFTMTDSKLLYKGKIPALTVSRHTGATLVGLGRGEVRLEPITSEVGGLEGGGCMCILFYIIFGLYYLYCIKLRCIFSIVSYGILSPLYLMVFYLHCILWYFISFVSYGVLSPLYLRVFYLYVGFRIVLVNVLHLCT